MAEVDNVSLRITATAQQAIDTLKKLRSGLYDVEASTQAVTEATEESSDAAIDASKSVDELVSSYKKMGLTSVAKEMGFVQKSIQRVDNLTASVKKSVEAAKYYDKRGNKGIATFIKELGEDPLRAEAMLRAEEAAQKAREALDKEAQKAFADGEKLVSKIARDAKIAAAQEAADKQKALAEEVWEEYSAIADEMEDLSKERTSQETATAKESERIAKEVADSDRAYRELTNNAIIEDVRRREEAIAKINEQKAKEQRIGAAALAKVTRESVQAHNRSKAYDAAQEEKAHKKAAAAAKEHAKQVSAAKASLGKFGRVLNTPIRKIGELVAAFKRIALYRAIRTAVRSITAALKEGLTNLYNYSKEVGTAFTPAVDNLRRHVLWLKNALATALRPVIEALIPVIQRLVDWLVKASDFIAQVFSVLTGKVDANGRYTKAVLSDLQESNKQAKELRRTLLGFDEINRLDGDTGSSESNNAGLMFTQADVSPEAVAAAEKIQRVWEKIREIIGQINWDAVWKILVGIEVLKILGKIAGWLQPIVALLGGSGGVVALIAAVVVAFALWGDEISDWSKHAKKDVKSFWKGMKTGSKTVNSVASLLGDFQGTALDIIDHLASSVYKLVRGDFKGAWYELKLLFRDIVQGLADILSDIINLAIGVAADIYNWAIVPLINNIATAWEIIKRGYHNNFIDFQIALLNLLGWIIDKINETLAGLEITINAAIKAWNYVTGNNVAPVTLKIDSANVDKKIKELEQKKLPPITEKVKVVGEWTPTTVKINVWEANRALDSVGDRVNRIVRSLSSAIGSSGRTIEMYASGGFPSAGSLFIAGETGASPELVGNFGGGTQVMNSEQLASALYGAFSAALAANPQGGDIYLDGEVIYRNTVRRNNNAVRATGRSALLT